MKTYFVKVSYTDPDQPLSRIHENYDCAPINLRDGIAQQVQNYVFGAFFVCENFTVDFMLEVPNE